MHIMEAQLVLGVTDCPLWEMDMEERQVGKQALLTRCQLHRWSELRTMTCALCMEGLQLNRQLKDQRIKEQNGDSSLQNMHPRG